MKIEGKPWKTGPVDFPPLPYLIYLFTCDSVTALRPAGAWIHIDRVSHLLQWVGAEGHSHGFPIPLPHSLSPPHLIKEVPMIACPQKTQIFNKGKSVQASA